MNHTPKNTAFKIPKTNHFGKLAVALESSLVDPFDFTVEYDGEYEDLGNELTEYLANSLSCTDIKPNKCKNL